nr:hypothetical protein [Tanacetum cinerariifolium]
MENQFDVQNHLVEIQADDHDLLVNSNNENDDMLGYESEKYSNDEDTDGTNHAEDTDGTNHLDLKLVKRGIPRLYKEYGKPDGIKIKVTFDALNRVLELHRALFLSFLGDLVCEHIEFVDEMDFDMDFGSEIPTDGPAIVEMVNATKESFDEDDLAKFQELLLDVEKPLYKECLDFTKLSAIVKLLNLKGVDTYISIKENFNLRAVVLWTINDYPAFGTLCGCPYSGFKGCVVCGKDAHCVRLSASSKQSYAGHRRYLPYNHPFRSKVQHIENKWGKGKRTNNKTLENQEDTRGRGGKIQKQNRKKTKEENVCESLVGTLLNVPGKTKDGLNARLDLAELRIKPELFARQEEDKTTLPPAGYTLTNAKKDIFCETLSNIRVPQGYCLNFSSLGGKIMWSHMLSVDVSLRKMYEIIKGHVRNRNRLKGCIAEETIAEETIDFFSEYHKTMKTIGIPPDKHVTNENKDEKPLSVGKSSEVSEEVFQKAHLYVERELAISKDSVSETARWISYGPRATIVKYKAYNINGYTFCMKSNDGIVYQNSGVSVKAVDLHISKKVATIRKAFHYGVLQEIWVLDYRFRQIPLFKCDWVKHKAGGVKHDPNIGYTLVDLNSLGHKDDPFILAS